jgi:hypothetical protein
VLVAPVVLVIHLLLYLALVVMVEQKAYLQLVVVLLALVVL